MGSWMVLVALLGSLFSAIALQCVKKLVMTESLFSVLFNYFLFSMILCAIPAYLFWEPLNGHQWLLLTAIGLFLGITQLLLAKAYTYASPTTLGPFNYSVVIFAGLIQWIFWGTIPNAMGFVGIFLIVLGGLLTLLQQRMKQS
jgi:drug/metabolite transporter (DMT)-like permease